VRRRRERTVSFVSHISSSELEDFELLKELASGFIGRVYLTVHKSSREFFALKVMSQEGIIAQRQLERVFNEKKIHTLLSDQQSYQVVRLYKTFKDTSNVYLVMDYQPADLFSLLNQMHRHVMSEQDARFLVAVIVLTLNSMHSHGVIYRDLKPQNVLIDEMGYPLITDFGFSKMLSLKGQDNLPGLPPQTISFVGTPAYMAPELLKRRYYAELVDWWALGILVYEVLFGDVPFDDHGGDYESLLKDINQGLSFPKECSQETRDFVSALLHKNPDDRLGANGCDEIKAHPWFAGVDWNALIEKRVASPLSSWIPKRKVSDKGVEPDTRHFDLYKLYEKGADPKVPPVEPKVLAELFAGY
jgi:serine/threonine protein kinase